MGSPNKLEVTKLSPYMGVIGTFVRLEEQDGALLAEIAGHILVLPIELKDVLAPLLGQTIAILATDLPGKEHMIRVIRENNPDEGEDKSRIYETVSQGYRQPFAAMSTQREVI